MSFQAEGCDDNTPGNRSLDFSLGLCADDIEETRDGNYARNHHHCPHDSRFFDIEGNKLTEPDLSRNNLSSGCFYGCNVFKPARGLQKGIKVVPMHTSEEINKRIEAIELIPAVLLATDDGDL